MRIYTAQLKDTTPKHFKWAQPRLCFNNGTVIQEKLLPMRGDSSLCNSYCLPLARLSLSLLLHTSLGRWYVCNKGETKPLFYTLVVHEAVIGYQRQRWMRIRLVRPQMGFLQMLEIKKECKNAQGGFICGTHATLYLYVNMAKEDRWRRLPKLANRR